MSTIKVKNVSIEKKKFQINEHMEKLLKIIKSQGIDDAEKMLPQAEWEEVSFEIHNTFTGFANGIRRVLVNELDVYCLSTNKYGSFKTDDVFISGMTDCFINNINMIPINQEYILDTDKYQIFILKTNQTTEIIDVKASDIKVCLKSDFVNMKRIAKQHQHDISRHVPVEIEESKKKSKINEDYSNDLDAMANVSNYSFKIPDYILTKSYSIDELKTEDIHKIIPNPNITIMRLRPGQTIYIENIYYEFGKGYKNAAKFSLLDNITYIPLDVVPFDIETGEGTRSIEKSPTAFKITFRTCANISAKNVINLAIKCILDDLNKVEQMIELYNKMEFKNIYTGDNIEVTVEDGIYHYKLIDQYYTIIQMIAEQCYKLDTKILFCSATVERYDTRIGIIKLKHPEPNKLILDAIKQIKLELDEFKKNLI